MKKSKFLSLLSAFLALLMVFTSVDLSSLTVKAATYDPNEISIDLIENNAVDIMLVSRNSDFSIEQIQAIETNLKSQLSDFDVKFAGLTTTEEVTSTNDTDASEVFNSWSRFGSTGKWSLVTGNPSYIQNAENSDGTTGFYAPDTGDVMDMTLEYDFMSTDTDDDFVGVVLRLNIDDNKSGTSKPLDTKISGYWYLESHQSNTNGNYAKLTSGLYRLNSGKLMYFDTGGAGGLKLGANSNYNPFTNSGSWINQAGVTTLANRYSTGTAFGWTAKKTWIHYKYEMKGNTFSVWRDGQLVLSYTDDSPNAIKSGTFGLTNMSQPSRYRNFVSSVTRIQSKSMFEILRGATWREEAVHMVIDIDRFLDPTLTDEGEVTSRLISDDAYLQFWGSDVNQSSFTTYGESFGLDANGVKKYDFINQSAGYDACVTETADYVKKILAAKNGDKYGIMNEISGINVDPAGAKNNTIDSSYPNGKWEIKHDDTKIADNDLQNEMGVSSWANIPMDNLTCEFNRPGNYTFLYMDVPVKTVYIHRRPVADFTLGWNSSTGAVTISDMSYDLDTNLGTKSNGIKSVSWQYKKATDSGWANGVPSSWSQSDGFVIIKMTVTDYQGCSSSVAKYLGDSKPVASFSFDLNPVSLYENISVLNSSYDTTGATITASSWVIKDGNGNQVATNNTNSIGARSSLGTPVSLGLSEGTYTVYLTVTNSNGIQSETVSRQLRVAKIVSRAVYEYNWGDASHSNYATYADVYYKAKYPALTSPQKYYRINFDKNSGTQVDNAYLDAYSTFHGWYLEPSFTNKISSGSTTVESNGNHYIYAKWTDDGDITFPSAKKIYTVNFDANDTELDRATLSSASLTETWTFNGWFEEAAATTHIGNAGYVANDVKAHKTVYAGWTDVPVTLPEATRTYTVTYDSNGGTNLQKDTQPVVFNGWYTKASGGTRIGTTGDKYTVNSDHTVYAQWGTASFVLPYCKKDGTFFIGWFDKAQTNGSYENTSGAKLIGTAGQTVQLKSSQTLYAWFNTAPEINQIDSADFYEGQYVFGRDFIQFVEPKDIESEQAGQTLEVELVSIEYNDGNKKELSEDTLIETSTNHIGEFKVTYSVTDIGISIDGKLVPNSQVTTEETFTFKVLYNDLPQMVLNPVIYTYTSDASLVEATIASFLKSYVTLSDAQDDVDNKPWWDVDVTSAYLKQSLEITEVKDILVNPAYEMEHADIANAIRNSTSVEQLYALKISNPEAFNAIMSYKVVFDAKDQWGKFVSGKLAERAVAHGVRTSEIDKKQSEDDRSITVISVNDSAFNDTYESIRSVNDKYASSVNRNSYWGDENYGGKILNEILSKRSNKDSEDHEIYEGLYAQVTNYGNNRNILVNDYAN